MAKLPQVKQEGYARPYSSDYSSEITDVHIQEFEYKGEKYDLIYKSMDPNTNKMVVVKPDVAKAAIKEFIKRSVKPIHHEV